MSMYLRFLPPAALLLLALPLSAQDVPVAGACARPDTIAFRGNERVSDLSLRADAGIVPGTPLNYRAVQRAVRNLYATAQFEDVAVVCEPQSPAADGRTVLAFTVRERPLLRDFDVRGTDRLSASAVRTQVDLLVGRPLDPSLVARSVARIDSLYQEGGYYLARVNVDTSAVADGAVSLTFRIDEGRRLAISGIRVLGNEALRASAIAGAMETKPEGFFWWQKGEFDDDTFLQDLAQRIPEAYAQRGYVDAQVIRDTLIVDRELGKAMVEITVREGPQYLVGDFEITGARRFSSEELGRYYPFGDRARSFVETVRGFLRRGDGQEVFNRAAWEQATQQIQARYADEGYIYATIDPQVERIPTAPGQRPRVNLRWDIDERTPAIVNRVEIAGNDVTTESCIRDQLFILPGDVFNRDLLIRSWQNISNLGFFEAPMPFPETRQANDQGDIDLIFRVEEKRTGNVSFGASLGQGTGVGGFIGFDQPNLFGRCKRGSLQWQYGQYINDFNMSYTDPRIRESQVSGTVMAYHSQSRFIIRDIGRTTRTGAQLRFGVPFPNSRVTRFYTDYGAERVSYGDEGLVGTIECRNCVRSTLGFTVDHDTRLGLPFPAAGVHQSLSAQFNGGPLGGSASFQRYIGELRGYATLATFGGQRPGSQPIAVVSGLSTRAGMLFGNPGPFFVSQSFSMGGVQYGEPLRGYPEFSITPFGYVTGVDQFAAQRASFGNAFLRTSAELGIRFTQQIYVHTFFDAGGLWERPRDFDPTRLFRGAGFGGSIVTPLGPLGLDLGYGFDRLDQSGRRAPRWQVHFKFGQFF